jgi:hypothetical protein
MKPLTRKTLQWTAAQLMEIHRDNVRIMKQLSLRDADNESVNLDDALLELENRLSVVRARVDFERRQILLEGE